MAQAVVGSAGQRRFPAPAFKRAFVVLSQPSLLLGAGSAGLVLLIWELTTYFEVIHPIFLASPTAIARSAYKVFVETGEIYPHLWVSFQEAIIGFVFAIIVGVPCGLLIARFATVRHVLEPWVMALYSTPTVALLPLFILWLGIGLWSKALLIFLGGVFPILVNTQAGVQNTSPRLIETARAFTASELQIFGEIMLPSAVPFIIAGIRLAIGRILIMVFVAEFYASTQGVGFLIMNAGAHYKTSLLFVGVLIFTFTGVAFSEILRIVELKMLARYQEQ